MFFGPITNPENKKLHDMNRREILAVAPLVAMIFVIGLFPKLFLSQIQGAAGRVEADLEDRIKMHPAPKFYEGPIRLMAPKPEATPAITPRAAESTGEPAQEGE
jgi:NADH-quinone oxidoreductase subunit M